MELLLFAVIIGSFTALSLFLFERLKRGKSIDRPVLNKFNGEMDTTINQKLIDYKEYQMTSYEYLFYSLIAGIIFFLIGFIFYQNIYISIIFSALGLLYPRYKKRELIAKRKQELLLQFKQALYSISTALGAGKSIENAFFEAANDLRLLYPNPKTYIIQELEIINRRIENGEPIEKALTDFSRRTNIEDIGSFSDVFVTCKRTGGDLVEVIRRTSNIIGEKIDIQQEISVLIAQKKFEAQILSITPFIMIAIVALSSPDYMQPLYELGIGPIIMTVGLVMLVLSYWLINWIMEIKV